MPEFFEYVLWQLKNSFVFVAMLCVLALAVMVLLRLVFRGKRKLTWPGMLLWLGFLAYLAVLLYATILRHSGGYREYNWHLFRAWREAWNNFSAKNWGNVLLNVALFVPLGFFLPLLFKGGRKWYITVPGGFGISALIEVAQLALCRGICDVDDLFCNGLGAIIGYFAVMALLALSREKGQRLKPFLAYSCLTLVPLVAIGSIFIAYHAKEYGNFPGAPAYSVNLSHLEWDLECELPETEEASVFRAKTMNYEDCEAFAEDLAGLIGQEVDITSYYQEMAYYNLTNGVVMVNYHDGGYEFRAFSLPFEVGSEPGRMEIEEALEPYSITVPEAAVFAIEDDGWYSFTCDQVVDGAVMLDGVLRVRHEVTEDFSHLEIENYLIRYSHYQDVPILSPMKAYQELLRGNFEYAEALKYDAGDAVSVISCELDYEIDTKGFYQPVYRFEISLPGTDYICPAMIPAIK